MTVIATETPHRDRRRPHAVPRGACAPSSRPRRTSRSSPTLESAEDIVELVWQTRPDVLLLDIRMPQGSGLDAVPAVLKISPNTHVLVLTACDEKEEHVRAFRLGAKGVILKDSARQTLMQAIRTVCRGEMWMDPRMSGALVGRAVAHGRRRSDRRRAATRTASPSASSRSCAWSRPATRTRRSASTPRDQRAHGEDPPDEHLPEARRARSRRARDVRPAAQPHRRSLTGRARPA